MDDSQSLMRDFCWLWQKSYTFDQTVNFCVINHFNGRFSSFRDKTTGQIPANSWGRGQIVCTVFENHRKSLIQYCGRTELPDRSISIGQEIEENAKIHIETFLLIFKQCGFLTPYDCEFLARKFKFNVYGIEAFFESKRTIFQGAKNRSSRFLQDFHLVAKMYDVCPHIINRVCC